MTRKRSDKNTFHLLVIKDPTESRESLYEKAVSIRYLITQLKTLWAPPPFDSASFTFAHCIALSCLFDLIITIRETSQVTRWHGEFHYLSIMTLAGGGRRLPPLEEGGYPTGPYAHIETTGLPSIRSLFICYPISPEGLIKFQILSHLTQSSLLHEQLLANVRNPQFWRKGTPTI